MLWKLWNVLGPMLLGEGISDWYSALSKIVIFVLHCTEDTKQLI